MSDPLDVDSRERLAAICEQLGRDKMAEVWREAASESRRLKERQTQSDEIR
jgi:hypothetical protein